MNVENIHIKYFRPNDALNVVASSTQYYSFQFPKHFHNHYTILLIEEGVNEGFTEKIKYQIGKQGILIINPGEMHAGTSPDNTYLKFSSLRITPEAIHTFCSKNRINKRGDIYFNNSPIYDNRLALILAKAIQKAQSANAPDLDETNTELLDYLLEFHSNQSVEKKLRWNSSVRRAYQYLHEHFDQNFSLDELAKAAFMSPYHLIRQFKKHYGLTPFQYLNNLRIEKAKPLLIKGDISGVASEVGFFDHSHFIRTYKKIEGALPSNFTRS